VVLFDDSFHANADVGIMSGSGNSMLSGVGRRPEPREHQVTMKLGELLHHTALGDRRAFEELYLRLDKSVMGTVQRQLVDWSQSEEVTQEVFLEIWQHASRFRANRGSAATWIHTIARRRAIDRVRASQASRERDLAAAARDTPGAHDVVWERVVMNEDRDSVHEALSRISPWQREAIGLKYFDEQSDADAAAQVGASVAALKARRWEALRSLRRQLDANYRDVACWV
jgi:RNA polymerase sigma-70 factor (ECF subfamily)